MGKRETMAGALSVIQQVVILDTAAGLTPASMATIREQLDKIWALAESGAILAINEAEMKEKVMTIVKEREKNQE